MESTTTPARKKRASTRKSPVASQLSRYNSQKTPKAAVDLMLACANVGENCWDTVMTGDVAASIAAMPALEEKFLQSLCKQPGLPYSAEVMGAYLRNLSDADKKRLLGTEAILRRTHPFNTCIYGASFSSEGGQNLTRVLEQAISHGLCVETLVARNMTEIERAASLGHRNLLKLIAPRLRVFPEEVIRYVLQRGMHPIDSISMLVDECGVPLSSFATTKLLSVAKEDPRCYISGRLSREKPIPEIELKDEDSTEELFVPDRPENTATSGRDSFDLISQGFSNAVDLA